MKPPVIFAVLALMVIAMIMVPSSTNHSYPADTVEHVVPETCTTKWAELDQKCALAVGWQIKLQRRLDLVCRRVEEAFLSAKGRSKHHLDQALTHCGRYGTSP